MCSAQIAHLFRHWAVHAVCDMVSPKPRDREAAIPTVKASRCDAFQLPLNSCGQICWFDVFSCLHETSNYRHARSVGLCDDSVLESWQCFGRCSSWRHNVAQACMFLYCCQNQRAFFTHLLHHLTSTRFLRSPPTQSFTVGFEADNAFRISVVTSLGRVKQLGIV